MFQATELPFYARKLSLQFKDPVFTLRFSSWKQTPSRERRVRLVGFLEVSMKDPATSQEGRHEYSVMQVERRITTPDESIYASNILIGNTVNKVQERSIFNHCDEGRRNLWCSHCWHENYVSGHGGVKIPSYVIGRYFSSFKYMQACEWCNKSLVASEETFDYEGSANVFSAFLNEEVELLVQPFLLPLGISVGTWRQDRTATLSQEQKEDVVAGAMHPKRVGCLLEAHGFEALDEVFGGAYV